MGKPGGIKTNNSNTHGQTNSLKRDVKDAGFEPLSNDEKVQISKFQSFLEQTKKGKDI
jgi:hypothetical protein